VARGNRRIPKLFDEFFPILAGGCEHRNSIHRHQTGTVIISQLSAVKGVLIAIVPDTLGMKEIEKPVRLRHPGGVVPRGGPGGERELPGAERGLRAVLAAIR